MLGYICIIGLATYVGAPGWIVGVAIAGLIFRFLSGIVNTVKFFAD